MKSAADIEKLVTTSLRPYGELDQPLVATFEPDSAELSPSARRYLDLLADTLRPGHGQLLILEGHASDAGDRYARDDAWLAAARAQAVKSYLLDEHGVMPTRVEARAFAIEIRTTGAAASGVDARLIQPAEKPES